MKKFTPVTKPVEVEFFSIYTKNDGAKYIHLLGYTYESDDYWANMEACGLELTLAEFIADSQKHENPADYVNELYEQCKQYQGDYTPEELVDVINQYYDGHNPDGYLGYSELTLDTPDGNYIC